MGAASGMFTMYTFDGDGSPFGFLENGQRRDGLDQLAHWVEKVPAVTGLRRVKRLILEWQQQRDRIYRQWIQNEAKKHANHAPPAFVPLGLLPHIGISEDNRPIHLPGALEQETILTICVRIVQISDVSAFNCEDEAMLQLFLGEARSSVAVILGQFSDSDC
jgi:hypothetical protein